MSPHAGPETGASHSGAACRAVRALRVNAALSIQCMTACRAAHLGLPRRIRRACRQGFFQGRKDRQHPVHPQDSQNAKDVRRGQDQPEFTAAVGGTLPAEQQGPGS